jgi:hypothetical protein
LEAVPGRSALVEGSWTARRLPQGQPVTCRAGIAVPLSDHSPDAAVIALSVGIGQMAEWVADSLARLDADGTSACPSDGS